MFIILLKFTSNQQQARQFMEGHKAWVKRGFEENIFLLAGSLEPDLGGAIVADNTSLSQLQDRVNLDPFVAKNIVNAEILEITPSRANEQLSFLLKE